MSTLHTPRFFGDKELAECLDGKEIAQGGTASAGVVARIQLALRDALELTPQQMPIDGIFGQLTSSGVQQYKASRAVLPVNAVVDGGTVAAFDEEFLLELILFAKAGSAPFDLGKLVGPRVDQPDGLAICEFDHGGVIEVGHLLAFPVPEPVWNAWNSARGKDGDYGAPIGNPLKLDNSRYYQEFENVTVIFSEPPTAKPVFFGIERSHWEASIAGRPQIGLPKGPKENAGPNGAVKLKHDNGVVLAVNGALPLALPQIAFDNWLALENDPGNKAFGTPTAARFPQLRRREPRLSLSEGKASRQRRRGHYLIQVSHIKVVNSSGAGVRRPVVNITKESTFHGRSSHDPSL